MMILQNIKTSLSPYFYRLPSCPTGDESTSLGYSFEDDSKKRASWLIAMGLLGQITEQGVQISQEVFESSWFCLPFKLSSELSNYGPNLSEHLLQKPIVQNGRYILHLEYENPTTKVIR